MSDLVGVGLFDRSEAARLTGVEPSTVKRWVAGYDRAGVRYEPLWPILRATEHELTLDFRDLMELRVVASFRRKGMGVRTIRKALGVAEQRTGFRRPFSTLRFKTDGARLFFEHVGAVEGERTLEDLFSGQLQLRKVIEQTLEDVDFDDDLPRLWWPMGRQAGIVIDPARSFGQPIDDETGIPVETLALAAEVEGGTEAAAHLFEVPVRSVRRAVRFEQAFRAAA